MLQIKIQLNLKLVFTFTSTFSKIADNVESCLQYSCDVIAHIDEFWLNGTLDIKQRLQRLICPKGLAYDLSNFRTAEMSSLFKIIGSLTEPYNNLVLRNMRCENTITGNFGVDKFEL